MSRSDDADAHEDDYKDCSLDLQVSVGPTYGEPSDNIVEYSGKIFSGNELTEPVGTISPVAPCQ